MYNFNKDRSISRNAILWTAWLVSKARTRQLFASRLSMPVRIAGLLLGAALLWLVFDSLSAAAASLIRVLLEYSGSFMMLVAIYGFVVVERQRRAFRDKRRHSWLTATPIAEPQVKAAHRTLTAIAVGIHGGSVALLVLLLVCIAGDLSVIGRLELSAVAGFLVGALVGRLAPQRRSELVASRYTSAVRAAEWPSPARLSQIARWPIAQVLAWHRPQNARLILLFALFMVQGGSSIALGVSVVAAWVLGFYLAMLLAATMRVARPAVQWLRSAPLSFASFAWALSHRALLHQVIGTVVGMVAVVVLGLPVGLALYLAVLWLTLASFVIVISLAETWRTSDPHFLKLSMSLSVLVAIELREHGWAIPTAFALAYWRSRRAEASEARIS